MKVGQPEQSQNEQTKENSICRELWILTINVKKSIPKSFQNI